MKKLFAMICSVGLLFSMSACSSSKVEDNALDALETSINKIVEMKTATYSMEMNAQTGKDTAILTISGGYLADTANPSFTAIIDMEAEGEKMNFMNVYYKESTTYMDMFGMKVKSPADTSEVGEFKPEVFKLNKDEIKPYLKTAKLKDGTITMELDAKKVNELVAEANKTDQGNALSSITNTATSSNIKKFNMVVDTKDDFITKAVIDFEGTTTTDTSTEENVKGVITITFNDINKGKALTFPDLSEYKES